MVSVLEVNAQQLINNVAEKLKTQYKIQQPAWVGYVKTGVHRERRPQNEDWFFVRSASVLRKLYIEGNTGVGKFRAWYGGKQTRGVKPEHHADASGNIIRKSLQSLEKAGLVKKENVGRIITPEGRKLLDKATLELRGKREKAKPKLEFQKPKKKPQAQPKAPAKPQKIESEAKTEKKEVKKSAARKPGPAKAAATKPAATKSAKPGTSKTAGKTASKAGAKKTTKPPGAGKASKPKASK